MKNMIISINPDKLSHELRTPLTGILGLAEELKHEPLTPKQQEYIEDIQLAGARLLSAINSFLGKK